LSIPLRYLMSVSDSGVENFTLKRLSEAANLRKEAEAIEREAMEIEVDARVAAWLIENRAEILRTASAHLEKLEDVRERESDAA
jgi:hypothetical protein